MRESRLLADDTTANSGPSAEQLSQTYDDKVIPLLKKYCADCHSGKKPEGNFSLANLHDQPLRDKARLAWAKMLRKIRESEMPPKDDAQPQPAERDQLTSWMVAEIKHIDATQPLDPGRVTMRRLNRAEYNNTIRDLVGIDFKPADDFPHDDIGYGFDNIGDVLWLPPILLEKYLSAAERIMDKGLALPPDAVKPGNKRFEAENFTKINGGEKSSEKHYVAFFANGDMNQKVEIPFAGEYTVRIRAGGDQSGTEACKMGLKIDNKDVRTFDVKTVKPKNVEEKYKFTKASHTISVSFLNDFSDPKAADPALRDRNLYVYYLELEGKFSDEPTNLTESYKKIMIAPPDVGKKWDSARKIVQNFADRAFRRPATTVEVDRLMKLFEMASKQGEPFEKSIQFTLTAVLVSPHFLFRVEREAPAGGSSTKEKISTRPLNEYELASRLSYFLWSSMPDDELFAMAKKEQLRANLEAQVRRMLKDKKSQALVDNFAGQWLQTRRLENLQPDPKMFPAFDVALRDAMKQETELFFATIMNEDRSVLEFVDSDWTMLNERLAKHYGIPGVSGSEFRRVTLPKDNPRGGVLTQATVLAVTSNPTRTSPVKRGKWVLENLLGTPPPPPPEMLELAEDKGGELKGTLRQRMEQHRADPNCTSCHLQLDPPGFGLENFDAVGAFRSKEKNEPIDASGILPGNNKFNGAKELKALLKQRSDLFSRCLAEKMLIYAIGRGVEDGDERSLDRLVTALKQNNHKFSALVIEIAKSEPFQLKRLSGPNK